MRWMNWDSQQLYDAAPELVDEIMVMIREEYARSIAP